jgi:hypothetical protein
VPAENLNTSEKVSHRINAADMKGAYVVTAEKGVQIDDKTYEKGDRVSLTTAVARALFSEGSIKEATE